MYVTDEPPRLRALVAQWRGAGETVTLVPTMGALHEGHLSLVDQARELGTKCIATIFVNPKQFGPTEDLDTYPRDLERDLALFGERGVDAVYTPNVTSMYPADFSTAVTVSGLTDMLCGASRPHFFGGVTTVVCKLLNRVAPDIAIFGEKDYQQLLVIKRMAADLDMPVQIVGVPIVREPDGLAMSSRNRYLSEQARAMAALFPKILAALSRDARRSGDLPKLLESARVELSNAGFIVDYLEVRDADTLALIETLSDENARLFSAAYLHETRLIDNWAIT